MPGIDLHVHSTASDGTLSPREVVASAKEKGLEAIALTDHDTVGGLAEAVEAGREFGVEVIPGCELSVVYGNDTMHILGLWLPPEGGRLAGVLEELRNKRHFRNERIIQKLQDQGIPISYEEVKKISGQGSVGRPHIARILMEKKIVKSVNQAFQDYIGPRGSAYVPKDKLSPLQALEMFKEEKATILLAHPHSLNLDDRELESLVCDLHSDGLDGIEAFYPEHTPGETETYLAIAQKCGLLVSGGSDFHGSVKPDIQLGIGKGNLEISYDLLQAMKDKRKEQGFPLIVY